MTSDILTSDVRAQVDRVTLRLSQALKPGLLVLVLLLLFLLLLLLLQ